MSATLIYVVGPSGAGKDSVLAKLRELLEVSDGVVIAHRYITRPSHGDGENHIALSPREFQQRLTAHCFALHWRSHNLHYGVGREIDLWLAQGLRVLVNGSREYLPHVRARYPEVRIVEISASPSLIEERLMRRGRESAQDVAERVLRNSNLARCASHFSVRNEGRIETAAQALLDWLRSQYAANS